MISRLVKFVTSLVGMLAAYWGYALAVVPFLEPSVTIVERDALPEAVTPASRPYDHLFPPGSWERDRPKVLATEQGALFIKDYQPQGGGRLLLKPCTMVLFTSRAVTETGAPAGRPIVLQSPDGAVLQFDGEADLSQAKIGRLLGGRLAGEVTIRSPSEKAEGGDELLITTRNLQMDERRIWTTHDVHFRYGANSGSGRDLVITLRPRKPRGLEDGAEPDKGGVKSLELVHLEKLELQVPRKSGAFGGSPLLAAKSSDASPAHSATAEASLPVTVTCRGPFQFNFEDNVATFDDDVDVLCLGANGPSDQLNCERLEIHFTGDGLPTSRGQNTDGRQSFQPERVVAKGFPAILRVPSVGATVRGELLEYNLKTRRVRVQDSERVLLQERRAVVEAPWLEYELAEAGGLGRLLALGPGTCRGKMEASQQPFEATWGRELVIQPQDGNQVISFKGDARVGMEGVGKLTSDELHVFLLEEPEHAPERGTAWAPTGKADATARLALDRLLARGNVHLDSTKLSNRSQELHVWFRKPPAPGGPPVTGGSANRPGRVQPVTHSSAADSGPANGPLAGAPFLSGDDGQKFELVGRLVQLELTMSQPAAVTRATIDGGVEFRQRTGAAEGEAPFSLTGDTFLLEDGDTANPRVRVVGKPAKVGARGLDLKGSSIQLLQGDNLMWIDGYGEMTVPTSGSGSGLVAGGQPAHVTWRKAMRFDGQKATFEGDVQTFGASVLQDGQSVDVSGTSQTLTVLLNQRLNFAAPRPSAELGAKMFRFDGGLVLQNRGQAKDGTPSSFDELRCPGLLVDQQTGEIRGDGAGRVWTVRKGSGTRSALPAGPRKAPAQEGLIFLEVDFQEGIRGDVNRREIRFVGDVRTVYGPVTSWSQRLDPEVPEGLGDDGVLLTCDQLAVREMGTVRLPDNPEKSRAAFEMEAWGNANVKGKAFAAWAEHLAYAESKDQLMLEGSGRADAVLTRYPQTGGPPSLMRFRKILFWPKTNAFDIQDAATITVPNLKQFQKGSTGR